MKSVIITTSVILVLVFKFSIAQTFKLGEISKVSGERFDGVGGQIENSVYTVSSKGDNYFINKLSPETMKIESTQPIFTGKIKLSENTWAIVKVANKLELIVVVGDANTSYKIYGKVIVEKNGTVNANDNLQEITDWESPELNGKKVSMNNKIKIIASTEIKGMPADKNKILIYFKLDDYHTTKLFNFVVLNADLNKIDAQITDFDNSHTPLFSPLMDATGNFYLLPDIFSTSFDNEIKNYFVQFYEVQRKKFTKREIPINLFKNEETPYTLAESKISDKGNLIFTGEYIPKDKKSEDRGVYYEELNINGDVKFDYLPINSNMFDKSHVSINKKAVGFATSINIGLSNNYVIVSKTFISVDKSKMGVGDDIIDFCILRIEDNSKLKRLNNYTSTITTMKGTNEIITPLFEEKDNKLFMVFQPSTLGCRMLEEKTKSLQACMVNKFDLSGGLETTYLYSIDNTNPSIKNQYKLADGSYLFWGKEKQGFVKISFD